MAHSSAMTSRNIASKIQEWRQSLEVIYQDVVNLHHNRRVFREVRAIIDANPALQTDHTFWNWLVENYAAAIAVGVRRQADRDPDVISMAKLLDDLEKNAVLLTRDWFVAEYTLKRSRQ